jgi:hypothetical protein
MSKQTPGPREFWLTEPYADEQGIWTPGKCYDYQLKDSIHVIEYAAFQKLESELREAQKRILEWPLKEKLQLIMERDQLKAELAEAKNLDLTNAVLAKDIDVAAERDAYKADADLKTDAYLRTLQKYENLKEHAEAFSDAAEKLLSDYTCQKCMYPDEPVSHDCDRYEEIKEDGRRQFKKAFEDYQKFLKGGAE